MHRFTRDVDPAFMACSTTTRRTVPASALPPASLLSSDHMVGRSAEYAAGATGRAKASPVDVSPRSS